MSKVKFKQQIILKDSKMDIGFGPGVLLEKPLELSERTLELLDGGDAAIVFARIDCETMFLMDHVEVRTIREEEPNGPTKPPA